MAVSPLTASDIYSYGMVLWELLTHATPFADAQGNTDLISKWVVTDRETETIPGDCPPQLAELIKKCWAFKPEDRILMDGIQKELGALVKAHPLSPETRAIIETLKKSQEERETRWNARWQGKRRDAEQKQKEELHEIEIKKQVEIDKLQQQHQAEQLALQKKMKELDELQSAKLAAAEEEKRRIEQEKQQKEIEIERLKQQHQENLRHAQEDQKRQTPFPVQSPKSTPPLPPVSQIIPQTILLEPTAQLALQDQLIAACNQGQQQSLGQPAGDQLENELKAKIARMKLRKDKTFSGLEKLVDSKSEPMQSSLSQNLFTITPAPKPVSKPPIDEKNLNQLLQYVAEGEQDKAEELIKQDKNLLLHTGIVKDLSDREFKQITAFQYALWAMDWHMWTMIQKYLPKEAQAQQLQELETKGTAYGKHFSLQGLTGALQTYVDNVGKLWKYDKRAENYWQKVVGGEQKLLPVHVVNEYCRPDRPFDPCPSEWEAKLPRSREVPKIWDSIQSKYIKGSWFIPSSSKDALGLTYAFPRGNWREGMGYDGGMEMLGESLACDDLRALQSLWKTRTQQLEFLKSQLLSTVNPRQELEIKSKQGQESLVYQPPSPPPLVLQTISQTILPSPKPKASPEQLALQDQLIAACKQGDEKAVRALLQQGAKPDMASAKGEQPLGAAVWGMCPDVVNALLRQADGVALMTWQECEKHNLERYKEVFIIPKFDPQTFGEWNALLQKMDPNPFIRAYHLKKEDERCHGYVTESWNNLKRYVSQTFAGSRGFVRSDATERGFVNYRSQIKQVIETAKQPLAQEQLSARLVTASEQEKRRLEAEKQVEIERLKQQNQQRQLELKHTQVDLKYQTPVQPPKSTPLLPVSVSQTISQTLISPSKPKASLAQLNLQAKLIAACKQGDEKKVTALLKRGAKPDMAGNSDEQPLGAAVWGMCPGVVNALLKQTDGVAPMTWEECEKHNLKHYYQKVFLIPKFNPKTSSEWGHLLSEMEHNRFIRTFHLEKADESYHNYFQGDYEKLMQLIAADTFKKEGQYVGLPPGLISVVAKKSEEVYVSLRSQIKQIVETAKQPTVRPMLPTLMSAPKPADNSKQLELQDQLVAACKRGDEKAVTELFKQGAKPDMANALDEQPLAAAVWGMNPEVVNKLLKQAGGVAPMSWEECKKHNLECYREVFIVPIFYPISYSDWYRLLEKIDHNLFIRAFHLEKVDEQWHDESTSSWENLKKYVKGVNSYGSVTNVVNNRTLNPERTEAGYVGYRTHIKQAIEAAKHPTVGQTSSPQQISILTPKSADIVEQWKLQDQLIIACEQGDLKEVQVLFNTTFFRKMTAKPNLMNRRGKHPLGAAVWGMNLDVVNVVLKQAGGVVLMTWEECEEHNLRYYKDVFILPRFDPKNYANWYDLLLKMERNPFIRAFHLKIVYECNKDFHNWESLKKMVGSNYNGMVTWVETALRKTRYEFESYRRQIEQGVKTAERSTVRQTLTPLKQTSRNEKEQQHHAELKLNQKDIKRQESSVQPPKPMLSLPPVSLTIPQTLMAPPKPKATREQLALQDQLIAACKQGDAKAVGALLQRGAQPDIADAKGEQPLGAAVWGMCPDVVNALLKQAGGVTPMTWEECEKHNLKYYNEVFIIPKFDPWTFGEWNTLLQKMDPNPFIRAYHLKKADEQRHDNVMMSWDNWKKCLSEELPKRKLERWSSRLYHAQVVCETEKGFVNYRSQIKQGIESAKQPTVRINF